MYSVCVYVCVCTLNIFKFIYICMLAENQKQKRHSGDPLIKSVKSE